MDTPTRWYHYLAYFFGGAFLANVVPHLVNGDLGPPVPEPVRLAAGGGPVVLDGERPLGAVNLAVAYLLVVRVGRFDLRNTRHVGRPGSRGIGHRARGCPRHFGKFHGGNL